MRNVKNITIEGKEYPCLLTVTIVRVLEDAGFTIHVYENPAAMLAECVKIVWAGCKNYADYLQQPFDLTLMDVDIWATENKDAFGEIVTLWAELNKPVADRSGAGAKDEEKKELTFHFAEIENFLIGDLRFDTERVFQTTFHEYFLLVEGFLFRQGEEQRLIRRVCYELQMSNTMLKPVFRPKSPLDMWRTYGEYEQPKKIEIDEADIEKDMEYFANKGKKILY